MSQSEIDDLLGVTPTRPPAPRMKPKPGRGRGRPTNEAALEAAAEEAGVEPGQPVPRQSLMAPMGTTFLAQLFGLTKSAVREKLASVEPAKYARNNSPEWQFRDVAPYLVKPKDEDLAEYIANLHPDDLPEQLQDRFWSARLKQQTWRRNAGDLWPTESVQKVLGETFMQIKSALQLHIVTINQTHPLTSEQRAMLVTLNDQLSADIYARLSKMPQETETPSQVGEMDGVAA